MHPTNDIAGAERILQHDDDLLECNFRQSFRTRGPSPEDTQLVTMSEFYQNRNCFHDLMDTTVFFHVGKGGGGTVERELQLSRIGVSISHPGPRTQDIRGLRHGSLNTLITNIRDPVDRFVSAFYWSIEMYCTPTSKNPKCQEPANYDLQVPEYLLLTQKYKSNVNALAEALCEDSPYHREATDEFASMWLYGHKRPLSSWLQFLIDPSMEGSLSDPASGKGIQNFIAIPMEKQNNEQYLFNQHIQRLTFHLVAERYGEQRARDIILSRPEDTDDEAMHNMEHHAPKTTLLSPLGECCMARQFQADYQLIQTMLLKDYDDGPSTTTASFVMPLVYAHPVVRKACSWGSGEQQELCKSDLSSMISRRARYLDQSLGTCSDVVSSGMEQK